MSGPAQLAGSLDVLWIPSTRGQEAQVACAKTTPTAAPDYNTSSSSLASVTQNPGAAAGKPHSCCGQDV